MSNRPDESEACPSAEALAELLSRNADSPAVRSIRRHLQRCERCRKTVAAAGDADTEAPLFLRPGSKLGRYAIQDVLGVGGMGIVYAAHDGVLDRTVALKVLLPSAESVGDERAWLEREAQAMAQLSHANVVTVFDIGQVGSYPYLAMELVVGRPLSEWLVQRPARARVLEVLLAAGRGLAAAHGTGIVHGDFKPSNVLVGDDGGVLVTDFGLASRATDAASSQDGAVVAGGTPRYLAPECKDGEPPSVLSDVYSYSISLYEALTSGAPEGEPTPESLETLDLPERLRTAIRHGLVLDPGARAPNVDELLQALATVVEPGPAESRSLRGLGVAAVGLATLGGVAFWAVGRGEEPCKNIESDFESVWDATRRASVQDELSKLRTGFAESTRARVDARLDAYAREWVSRRRETCEATLIRHEKSADMMSRRLQCLEGRKQSFDAVVEVLETPGLAGPEDAGVIAAKLPPLALCLDDAFVLAADLPPEDPDTATRVKAIRADLARVQPLLDIPDYTAAQRLATEAIDAAREVAYEPVLVEALYRSALVSIDMGEYDAALADANTAYERTDGASRTVAADVHRALAYIHEKKGEFEASLREARKGLHIASKALGDEHPAMASYRMRTGRALEMVGRPAEAIAEYEQAFVVLGGEAANENDMLVGGLHNYIGTANYQLGNYEKALASYQQSLAIVERLLGPDHPNSGTRRSNIGGVLYSMERYEEALIEMRLALAIREGSLTRSHSDIADVRSNIGTLLQRTGDYEGALKEHQEALSIYEVGLGEAHPKVAIAHSDIGLALLELGHEHSALAEIRTALEGLRGSLGPNHPRVAQLQVNLGGMLNEMGRHQEALDTLRAALTLCEAVMPPGHDSLWIARQNLAVALRELGRPEEALQELREALAVCTSGGRKFAAAAVGMNLGITLHVMGRYTEALEELLRTLALQREILPPEHRDIADTAAAAVFAAARAGSVAAIPPALEVLDDVIARRPHDIALPALRRMIRVITRRGEPDRAGIVVVESAREILHEEGHHHFVEIADAWLATHGS